MNHRDTEVTEKLNVNDLTEQVIGASIEVHRSLGPGLLETSYEECLCHELMIRQISFERQFELPLVYKGKKLDSNYRVDLLIDDRVVIELKATERILPIHEAQLLSYMKHGNWKIGLIVNFNVPVLKQGIRRRIID